MSKIDMRQNGHVRFISVRRWQAGVEWRPPAHSHPFCEIIAVLRGTHHVEIGGKVYDGEPGQVLFYAPGCVHKERQVGSDPLEFLCADFEWEGRPCEIPVLLHDRQGRLREIIRWLVAEDHAVYTGRLGYQNSVTEMLTGELLRLVSKPSDDLLSNVQEYIHQNLEKAISLDALAEFAQVNKFYLARLFRAQTGTTPMEYVRHARLDVVCHLLFETDLPLREIAPRTGFANEYHLSRLLKARYGRGARELRKEKYQSEEFDR